jgi:molybdopterin-guanine dinucleotide biosynthesis protein A
MNSDIRKRKFEAKVSDILISGDAVQSLMAEAALRVFKSKLEGYQSPLEGIITDAFKVNSDTIRAAVYKATADCVNSPDFANQLTQHLNHKLANLVISKCSGLVEKSFQGLMQDAMLRTKLQSAVVSIIERETGGVR